MIPEIKENLAGLPLWALGTGYVVWFVLVLVGTPLAFRLLLHFTKKTKSGFDDRLVGIAKAPTRVILLLLGAGIALESSNLHEHFVHYARSTVFAGIVITIIVFADRLTRLIVTEYLPRLAAGETGSPKMIRGIARGLVAGVGFLILLDSLGVSITPILGTLGIGSFAVALALKDTLEQVFAGIYVSLDKPIRVGDFVRLGSGEEGQVVEIGWRSTRLQTAANTMIFIPNSKLASTSITNFHMPDSDTTILIAMTVANGSDLARVEAVAIEVAREAQSATESGVPSFVPTVRFTEFAENGINLNVGLRVRNFPDQVILRSAFITRIHARFAREGIVIPYPVRDIRMPKGAGTAAG